MSIVLLVSLLIACLAGLEVAIRIFKVPSALARKAVHTGTALIVCGTTLGFAYGSYVYVGLIFIVLLLMARWWFPLKSLKDRSDWSYGDVLFPAGVAVAAFVAPTSATFLAAMLILGISDTVAYYAGQAFHSPKLVFDKTVAGTLAFAISAAFIASWQVPLHLAILVGVVCALAELVSPNGSDNLTVPLAASALLAFVH